MADTGKADDKGAAAVRAVSSGASIADVSKLLGISPTALKKKLQRAFVEMITGAAKKKRKKKPR